LSLLFFSLLILTSILSIDGKEFSKLLVKIKKKDHHHSDGWELTKRIVVITWAAALRHEAVHLNSKELTYAGMKRWIFHVPLNASY